MKTINKIISVINKICLTIAVCMLIFICVTIFVQIIIRKLGGTLIWADEMTRYAFIWLVLFGTVEIAKDGGHITIVAFLEMLPKTAQKVVDGIIYLFVTGFCGVLACAYIKAIAIYEGVRFSVVTAIPMSAHYVLISILIILVGLESLLHAVTIFLSIREEGGENT